MKFAVHFAQAVSGHVRVNLRWGNARVSEEVVEEGEVRGMIEQVGGEAVPQHVRRDISLDARQTDAAFDAQPKRDRGEGRAAFCQKHSGGGSGSHQSWPACLEIPL